MNLKYKLQKRVLFSFAFFGIMMLVFMKKAGENE